MNEICNLKFQPIETKFPLFLVASILLLLLLLTVNEKYTLFKVQYYKSEINFSLIIFFFENNFNQGDNFKLNQLDL